MVNNKKSLLITGGLGFIGFNYLLMLFKKNITDLPQYVINIDNETYAANFHLNEKKKYLKKFKQYKHFKYDICDNKKIVYYLLMSLSFLLMNSLILSSQRDRASPLRLCFNIRQLIPYFNAFSTLSGF